MTISRDPLVVILGETATGKSKLAIGLAKKLNGEIICADSWTVRKELNIGADKPRSKDLKQIRHHLLDIVNPDDHFSVVMFKELALKAIEDIRARNKVPIMVGGTGLYIDSVIYDYGFLEDSEPALREYLNSLNITELLEIIRDNNLKIGSSIDQRNKRRLIRFIESKGRQPTKAKLRDNTILIGLSVEPEIRQYNITSRVDKMIENGLEEEVRALSLTYGWHCEALKGVGYKQWQRYIEGSQSLIDTRQQIISATNNLAKKQRTWFKRNKSIHWISQPVVLDDLVELVTTHISI